MYVGEPWKTQAIVRAALTLFDTTSDGIPGNDDLGAESSWYVMAAIGLYPLLPGADFYVLGTPLFPEVQIRSERPYCAPDAVRIQAPGAFERPYVRSMRVDGRAWDRGFITHAAICRGATIDIDTTADAPTGADAWASRDGAEPPSVCH